MPSVANKMIYPTEVGIDYAICTLAKTTYGDTTNAVQFAKFNARSNAVAAPRITGWLVKKLKVFPLVSYTGTIQATVWRTAAEDTTDANPIPLKSISMSAFTLAQTTAITEFDLGSLLTPISPSINDPIRLSPGDKLWASIGVALAAPGARFICEYEAFF